jgi:hypothetical protein
MKQAIVVAAICEFGGAVLLVRSLRCLLHMVHAAYATPCKRVCCPVVPLLCGRQLKPIVPLLHPSQHCREQE